jgi:hypothetical protein
MLASAAAATTGNPISHASARPWAISHHKPASIAALAAKPAIGQVLMCSLFVILLYPGAGDVRQIFVALQGMQAALQR